MVNQQAGHHAAAQPRAISLIEDRKPHTIEARQALFRAQPQITIRSLRQRQNRILRKPRIRFPDLPGVLRNGFGRIKASPRGSARQQEAGEQNQHVLPETADG